MSMFFEGPRLERQELRQTFERIKEAGMPFMLVYNDGIPSPWAIESYNIASGIKSHEEIAGFLRPDILSIKVLTGIYDTTKDFDEQHMLSGRTQLQTVLHPELRAALTL